MKRRTLFAALLAGVSLLVVAGGDEASGIRRLALDDCLRIASERSARVVNARRDREIAETTIVRARADAMPHFTLAGTYTRLDELEEIEFGDEVMEFGTIDNYSVELGVKQTLYSGGRVSSALRAGWLSREYSRFAEQQVALEIERDVRVGFYAILLARENAEVRDMALDQLKRLSAQTEARHRQGTISEFEVLSARVRVQNALPEVIAASNDLAVAREDFHRLLDLKTDRFEIVGVLVQEPITYALEDLQDRAEERSLAIRMAEVVVMLREQDVASARADRWPSLSAFGTYQGANSYRFVSFDDEWEWHWNLGLSLSWDVWDGGLTEGVVAGKRLELAKERTDLEELRKTVRLEVCQSYLGVRRAAASVKAREGTVSLARRALEIAETRFRNGLATHLDVADANVALSESRLGRAASLHDQVVAVARLRFSVGGFDSVDGGAEDE